MLKIGANTLPVAGWLADPQRPDGSRRIRLAAIQQLIEGYGLAAVELTADLSAVYAQVFDRRFFTAVAGLQQGLGFVCTVHLPFLWVDASSLNEAVRQTSADCLCRAIELIQPVDVSTYVLHLWGLTTAQIAALLREPAQRQAALGGIVAQARRSLSQLCEILDPGDLCVENLEDPLFDLMLPLLEECGVSICLDVGHLAWRGDSELDFLARHGDRIREVHLHDAVAASPDGSAGFRDHLPLGRGETDYVAFLRKLEGSEYGGTVILENETKADLEESLKRVRAFL